MIRHSPFLPFARSALRAAAWICLAFAPTSGYAFDFELGLGAEGARVSQDALVGSGQALFLGAGAVAEIRVDLIDPGPRSFGVSVFGNLRLDFLTNRASDVNETDHRRNFGGGLDVSYGRWFIGGEISASRSDISGSQSFTLYGTEVGPRAGVHLPLYRNLNLTLGAAYGISSTPITVSTAPVTSHTGEFRLFLVFNFSFLSDGRGVGIWDTSRW